jgi:Putative beta-barrel porin-2, OmpL-like. bbp2
MRIRSYRCVCLTALCFAISVAALAQQTPPPAAPEPAPAPAAAPAPPPPPVWSVGPIDFSGLVDVYYDKNFNNPASMTNGLRNFDVKANQFSLNMAKLSLEHAADPVGFRVDFGFGRAFEIVHAGEPKDSPSVMQNIEQAFISLKPKNAKGFQVDFGKFVTSAGAEVIETKDNWNYSRSLLFAWAIPYYHFGVRTTVPMGKYFTGGVQVVNGWNNVEDNNSGKTIGLTGTFTGKKATWSNVYYTGPENTATNKGFRNLYDTNFLLTPKDQFNAYINFDYGSNKNSDGSKGIWNGVALAAKLQPTSVFALTPRFEYFSDHDGFSTTAAQKLKEFTITAEIKMVEGMFTRFEYRRDWSDVKFFERGGNTAGSKNQNTLLVGFVAFFGPKR